MTKIKIVSNPYQKMISYYIYDEADKDWVNITESEGYTGRLKAEKLIHGFFPFIVKEIVEDIIDEYDDSKGKIQLFFDGTGDEYNDLTAVCDDPKEKEIIDLQPIGRTLNNAYQVLPNIIEIFDKSVRPIVEQSISTSSSNYDSVKADLEKYSDAADDIIPICVIGNYSAGKSTFINALIGNEILPSGDKAVTARVYKIYQSKEEANAGIAFTVGTEKVVIDIFEDDYKISDHQAGDKIIAEMDSELSAINERGVVFRVNRALSVLNYFTNSTQEELGSVIEIKIPFNGGLWRDYPGKFVIFDTPGSNAASHTDHKDVLTKAMEGMSNGIPVYIAERSSLDSTDNESLYDLVKQMDGLDPRFTMIVVNKADGANLPKNGFAEDEVDEILHEAIPKNLYSSGIYFVSSIIGLGAKTNGYFIDDHCDETFENNKQRYVDESNRHYKELYKYDIMPEQIRVKAMNAAEEEAKENKLYSNSGLFSVEDAIRTFSSKYASYNKCQQAQMFLRKIIGMTKEELEHVTATREDSKREMEAKLEKDKQEMIESVESSASKELESYKSAYANNMQPTLDYSMRYPTMRDLKEQETLLTQEQQKNMDLDMLRSDAKQQAADVGDAIKGGFHKLGSNFGLGAIKEFGSSVIKETKEAIDSNSALFATTRAADRAAADDLINQTNRNFCSQAEESEKEMDRVAQEYWTACSATFRSRLSEVVKNTSLSEQKKQQLTELIVAYKKLEFDAVESQNIFEVDEFDYLLNFGDLKLFKMDKLFLNRLSSAYKSRIFEIVKKINDNIHDAYLNSFIAWEENLVNVVRENIVDYSPELREQQKKINEETAVIHDLQNRQGRLQVYAGDIFAMINWKEA